MRAAIIFLVSIVNSVIAANSDIYSGYSVHGVQLRHRTDQGILYNLQTDLNVDLWEHGAPANRDAYIMLSQKNRMKVFDILDANGIKHYVHISDVAKTLKEHEVDLSRWQVKRQNPEPFQIYARYAEINAYLERIARQYPSIATLVNAGKSFEGRDVNYLKISSSNFTNRNKPIYFMQATIHAREWVTTPVTLYSIHRLVEGLREEDKDLLENIDWIILPVVNPDGYEFSHTDNRLWRGTRSVNETANTTCIGVDPNRNFDVNFNTLGVSDDPCSQIYPGHEPFSEVETRNVRDILLEHIDRLQIFMDIHSWGNYILYGLDNATLPTNVAHQHHVAAAMGAHIDTAKLPQAGFYAVGNSNLMLYGTSGAASDYALVSGVPMSYTLELPGYRYGFLVPPDYIEQINTETWRGIAASARLASLYYRARVNS